MDLSLPPGRIYHLGYLVPHLEEAMAALGAVHGVEWVEPIWRVSDHVDVRRGPEVRQAELGVVYSRTGPTHLELIESRNDSFWSSAEIRLHHVGAWGQGELKDDAARLVAAGYPVAMHGVDEEGEIGRVSYHETPFGYFFEIVDLRAKAGLEAWMSGQALVLEGLG